MGTPLYFPSFSFKFLLWAPPSFFLPCFRVRVRVRGQGQAFIPTASGGDTDGAGRLGVSGVEKTGSSRSLYALARHALRPRPSDVSPDPPPFFRVRVRTWRVDDVSMHGPSCSGSGEFYFRLRPFGKIVPNFLIHSLSARVLCVLSQFGSLWRTVARTDDHPWETKWLTRGVCVSLRVLMLYLCWVKRWRSVFLVSPTYCSPQTLNQVNTVFRMGISPGHSLKDCFVYMAAYPGKVFEKLPLASGLRAGQWFDFSFDQVVLEIFIFSKSCYNFVFFQVFQISNFVIKIVFYFPD